PVRRRKGGHARVANRLYDGSAVRRDDFAEETEMRAHQIKRDEIPHLFMKLRRTFQMGKEEGEARDLEPLVDGEGIGAINITESLIGEEALRGQKRTARAEKMVKFVTSNPNAG